jgi:hypothetical protein
MRSNGKENWCYEKQVMERANSTTATDADVAVLKIIYNKYSLFPYFLFPC